MARLIENVLLQIVQNELMCQHVFLGVEREVYGGGGITFQIYHSHSFMTSMNMVTKSRITVHLHNLKHTAKS